MVIRNLGRTEDILENLNSRFFYSNKENRDNRRQSREFEQLVFYKASR